MGLEHPFKFGMQGFIINAGRKQAMNGKGGFQSFQEVAGRNLYGAEVFQMIGDKLRIEQLEATDPQPCNQMDQRHL